MNENSPGTSRRFARLRTRAIGMLAAACAGWFVHVQSRPIKNRTAAQNSTVIQSDDSLQQAAARALAGNDGTIIVMDPQTGLIRAVVNARVAFTESFAPGSTIKPFVTLAALRAGLITSQTRKLCRAHYSRGDFATTCAHPRNLPPFDPAEAIAYSCNYYFDTVGEQLTDSKLEETLAAFGFGSPTSVNFDGEAPGQLMLGIRNPRDAIGEGDNFRTTPIQLLTAYAALVNGGRLLTPRVGHDLHYGTSSTIAIEDQYRSVLLKGLRGTVKFGTA